MDQLQAMRVLVKVADAGSFNRAASLLDVSNATVTRAIGLLEAHLSTRLFNRTTRSLALTDTGRSYLENCRLLLDQLDEVEENISTAVREPAGVLRVAVTSRLSVLGMTTMFAAFRARYPQVKLRITVVGRQIDLVDEGYDAGIVVPTMIGSATLINRPLMHLKPVVVGAPGYFNWHKIPHTPADLRELDLLSAPFEGHTETWQFDGPDGREDISFDPIYTVNNSSMLRQAVLSGVGIAVLHERLVADDLARGAVVRLLADYEIVGAALDVSLIYAGRQYQSAKTRAFVEFVVDYFRRQRHLAPTQIEHAESIDTL
jgi:DNA-binding transcriptional LysR family regulator